MELCLELNPDRYAIVLGPQFVKGLHSAIDGPTLSYCDIVHAAIGAASATIGSEADRTKFEVLHKNAYELDPLFAYCKVSAKLRKLDLYDQWLRKAFESRLEVSSTDSIQHLLELQKKGALLMYTHCDDSIDRAANLPPVLFEDAGSWVKGERPGFLHVHGVYSKPSSVKLDYDFYDNSSHPHYADGQALSEYLKGRRALCIGFDGHFEDPLQAKFLESLGRNVDPDHHHIVVTSSTPKMDGSFLTLHIPFDMKSLECVLKKVAGSSQALLNQIQFPSNHVDGSLVIGLLVAGKQGCSDISSMMFKAPGVNFALISPLSYGGGHVHTVLIRLQATRLLDLWHWIFAAENASLVSKGLVGVALRCGTIIWIRGRPPVNPGAGSSAKEECANSLLWLSESSPRPPNSALNETLMKSLLLSKSTALAPPPLTRIPNLTPDESATLLKSRSAQPCCTSGGGGVKVEPDEDLCFKVPELSKTLLMQRRGSLPPQLLNRAAVVEEGRTSPLSAQEGAAPRPLPLPSTAESRASYILKARLLENGRKRSSPPLAPAATTNGPLTLKDLLQSKSAPAETTAFKRRRSDPGTQNECQDYFVRRKELFVKESRIWSESLQRNLERKVKRLKERKHRGALRLTQDASAKLVPAGPTTAFSVPMLPLSTGVQPPTSSLPVSTSGAKVSTATAAAAAAAAPAVVLQARFPPSINPYMFPQPIVSVSSASSTTPSVFYNPLVPSYTFVNSYHPVAQSQAYHLLPSNTSGRKVVYLMPTSNQSLPVTSGDGNVTYSPVSLPLGITGIMAPVPTAGVKQEALKSSPSSTTHQRGCHQVLSALLKNPAPVDKDSDPETPPSAKRKRSGDSSNASDGSPVNSKDLRMLLDKQNMGKARDQEVDDGVSSPTPIYHTDNSTTAPLTSEVSNGQQHQIQLWQFLLELLASNSQIISWTGQELEFQISQPDKVAELWGKVRNDPKMTYQKLAKGLCYYYTQGILKSVPEKLLTFRYTNWLKNYISARCAQTVESAKELVVLE